MSVQRKSDDMLDHISALSERLHLCEQQGKLLEAEKLSQNVAGALRNYSQLAGREIRQQQRSKQNDIEIQHERRQERLADKWEDRLKKYQQSCSQQEEELLRKQDAETMGLRDQIAEMPAEPKPSAEWLQMNKIKQHLMKNKAYEELHFTVKKLQQLENREQKAHNKLQKKKIHGLIEQMR